MSASTYSLLPIHFISQVYLFMLITLNDEQLYKVWTEYWIRTLYSKMNREIDTQNHSSIKENYILCWQNVPGAEYIVSIKIIKDIMSFIPNCSWTRLVFVYWKLWVYSNRWYSILIPLNSRNTFFSVWLHYSNKISPCSQLIFTYIIFTTNHHLRLLILHKAILFLLTTIYLLCNLLTITRSNYSA